MDQVNQDGQGDHVDSVWNSDRMLEATMEKKVFEITTEMTEDEKMNVFISGFFERINALSIELSPGWIPGWIPFSFSLNYEK